MNTQRDQYIADIKQNIREERSRQQAAGKCIGECKNKLTALNNELQKAQEDLHKTQFALDIARGDLSCENDKLITLKQAKQLTLIKDTKLQESVDNMRVEIKQMRDRCNELHSTIHELEDDIAKTRSELYTAYDRYYASKQKLIELYNDRDETLDGPVPAISVVTVRKH